MNLFCGFTWTRTKIDGLTVRSNRPLYDEPVCYFKERVYKNIMFFNFYILNIETYFNFSKNFT